MLVVIVVTPSSLVSDNAGEAMLCMMKNLQKCVEKEEILTCAMFSCTNYLTNVMSRDIQPSVQILSCSFVACSWDCTQSSQR